MVGAAHSSATPEQRKELAAATMPLVYEYGERSTNPARAAQLVRYILAEVYRVMGEDWEIPAEYKAQIEKLR